MPQRILLAVDSLDIGGAERHVVDLAMSLHARGYRVIVACSAGGPLRAELDHAGVPVRVLCSRLVKRRLSLAYAWQLRRLVRSERIDLVHAHVYASSVAGALAALGLRPLVLTVHGEARWQGARSRSVAGWAYRRAAGVLAGSEAIGRELVSRHRVPPDRVSVVPSAIKPGPSSRSLATRERGGPVIGVVARLQPEKGVDLFLRAAGLISRRYPRARYVIVGDGPERGRLAAQARSLGLQGGVQFLGTRLDARSLVAGMDVLVVPSRSEGSPLVVLEGMEAGLAVVASRVGGIPEQLRHEREGLLVPPDDVEQTAAAVLRLLGDPALARRLGRAGQVRVRRDYSYDRMLGRIEGSYRAALGETGAASWEGAPHSSSR